MSLGLKKRYPITCFFLLLCFGVTLQGSEIRIGVQDLVGNNFPDIYFDTKKDDFAILKRKIITTNKNLKNYPEKLYLNFKEKIIQKNITQKELVNLFVNNPSEDLYIGTKAMLTNVVQNRYQKTLSLKDFGDEEGTNSGLKTWIVEHKKSTFGIITLLVVSIGGTILGVVKLKKKKKITQKEKKEEKSEQPPSAPIKR